MLDDELKQQLLAFRSDRDWKQFHNLRTLSVSIALEAAELMEHSQWAKDEQLATIVEKRRDRIADEVADIAILLTYLAHDLQLDLNDEVRRKLSVNADKYPVERSRGSARKYTEFD